VSSFTCPSKADGEHLAIHAQHSRQLALPLSASRRSVLYGPVICGPVIFRPRHAANNRYDRESELLPAQPRARSGIHCSPRGGNGHSACGPSPGQQHVFLHHVDVEPRFSGAEAQRAADIGSWRCDCAVTRTSTATSPGCAFSASARLPKTQASASQAEIDCDLHERRDRCRRREKLSDQYPEARAEPQMFFAAPTITESFPSAM